MGEEGAALRPPPARLARTPVLRLLALQPRGCRDAEATARLQTVLFSSRRSTWMLPNLHSGAVLSLPLGRLPQAQRCRETPVAPSAQAVRGPRPWGTDGAYSPE